MVKTSPAYFQKNQYISSFLLFLVLFFAIDKLWAQSYPTKPIRLVIPYAVGGSTDQTGRLLAKYLTQKLGQPVVPENRAGAGGSLGHEAVAKSSPDGYTLLFSAAGPLTVTPHTYPRLNYDPIQGFDFITLIATQPLLLVVNPTIKANSVQDLIREAQSANPKLTYGSFGNGSAAHLAGEWFKSVTQVDMVHIPYKGSGPALVDLVGGQINLMFDVFSTAAPLAKAGKLKPIAITSAERSPQFPEVPTMQQAGIKDFDAGTWFGLLAPSGLPPSVLNQLSVAVNEFLKDREVRDILNSQGALLKGGSPNEFKQFFLSEYEKWGRIVRSAGVKAD